jgi:hypothetical protein
MAEMLYLTLTRPEILGTRQIADIREQGRSLVLS